MAAGDPLPVTVTDYQHGQCAEECWVMVIRRGEGYARCMLEHGHFGRHVFGFGLEDGPPVEGHPEVIT